MKNRTLLAGIGYTAILLALSLPLGAAPVSIVSANSRPSVSGAGPSSGPVFSGDGQAVAFVSAARNLVGGYTASPHLDVMIRYLAPHATRTVSLRYPTGGGGNGNSTAPTISSNGQRVAFASSAVNLLPPLAGYTDTNDASDVFVRDEEAGTIPASLNAEGTALGNGASGNPLISADGRWVVFESAASNLVAGDTNGARDIFRRDLSSGAIVRVSAELDSANLTAEGFELGGITPDAQRVAFSSVTATVVPVGTNTTTRITGEAYLRDLATETTWWATRDVAPFFANSTNGYAARKLSLSQGGRFLAFLACNGSSDGQYRLWSSTSYPSFDTTNALLFLFDSTANQLTPVSSNADSGCFPQISADGRYVAYADGTNVWRWDRVLVTNELVSLNLDGLPLTNGASRCPVMSQDGRQVMFYSTTDGLVTNTVNGLFQLYLRDMASASTRLVTLNAAGAAANRDSFPGTAVFSPDGTSVAFDSPADDLVADDANQASDVFVYRPGSNAVELVSVRTPNRPSASSVGDCLAASSGVSSNGQVVVFSSTDNQIASNDTNWRRDWFVMDLAAGTQASLTSGLQENPCGYPSMSADGRFVAFATTNIYSSTESTLRLHRHDLLSGVHETVTNVTISVFPYTQSIVVARSLWALPHTNLALISPGGSIIAFGLRSSGGTREMQIYDFDLQTNRILATMNLSSLDFVPLGFSPDGRWLAYAGVSTSPDFCRIALCNLADPQFPVRSLSTNSNRYLPLAVAFSADSRYLAYPVGDTGWSIYRHRLDASEPSLFVCTNCSEPSISGDGRFIAFVRRSYLSAGQRRDDLFVKDLQTGGEELVSLNRFGTNAANGMSYTPRITPDGRYVVFASGASDLVPDDTNRVFDVFIWDRLLKYTTCLSANQYGLPANGSSANPVLCADGRTVVFQSAASDLVYADYNLQRDVFAVRIGHDDTDGDGLDDDWEVAHFNDLSHDGTVDSDGDGASDYAEFISRTAPANQDSVLCVTTLVPQTGGSPLILFWQAVPGRAYQVQFKNSLSETNWSDLLPGTVVATTTTGSTTDRTSRGKPQRFYRVMLAP